MRTESEILRRIEQCEQRAKGYAVGAMQQKRDEMHDYWMEQSAIQDEIAHALKWVLNDD